MMVFTEELFQHIALELFGKTEVTLQKDGIDYTVDLKAPWKRMSMKEAVHHYGKINVDSLTEDAMRKILIDTGSIDPKEVKSAPRGILISKLFEHFADPTSSSRTTSSTILLKQLPSASSTAIPTLEKNAW